MKEIILGEHVERFDYHDHEVVGYLVGGELVVGEPDRETKKLFAGDWCSISYADLWSMIHNSYDGQESVVFWEGFNRYVEYTPVKDNDGEFTVLYVELQAFNTAEEV